MKDDITAARMELDIVCDIIHSTSVGDPAYSQKTTLPLEELHHHRQDGADIVRDIIHSVPVGDQAYSQKTNLPLER